jgi:hypothetical protein
MVTWSRMYPRRLFWICLLGALAATPAHAEADSDGGGNHAFIPEFDAYLSLTDTARVFLLADVTRTTPQDTTNGEVGVHLDYTLMPLLRKSLREGNWERDRYLWMRVGYRREWNIEGKPSEAAENRLLLQVTMRSELPNDVWLENRAGIDFRDIGGARSNRYRYRINVEREFTASGTIFVPYARAEFYYDTRYDAWSQQVYQVGAEIELSRSWRIEPYLGLQKNTRPSVDTVNQVGLILKYYH